MLYLFFMYCNYCHFLYFLTSDILQISLICNTEQSVYVWLNLWDFNSVITQYQDYIWRRSFLSWFSRWLHSLPMPWSARFQLVRCYLWQYWPVHRLCGGTRWGLLRILSWRVLWGAFRSWGEIFFSCFCFVFYIFISAFFQREYLNKKEHVNIRNNTNMQTIISSLG